MKGRIASMGFIRHFSDSDNEKFVLLVVDLERFELKHIMGNTKGLGDRRFVVMPQLQPPTPKKEEVN